MTTTMPSISLWQPWASLVALGVKTIETRSWPAPDKHIGRRIAIHAAKRPLSQTLRGWPDRERQTLLAALPERHDLPLGCVVATAVLDRCMRVNSVCEEGWARCNDRAYEVDRYGDFSAGRYLWVLLDIKAVDPIPATGHQGVWTWEAPCPTPSPRPAPPPSKSSPSSSAPRETAGSIRRDNLRLGSVGVV